MMGETEAASQIGGFHAMYLLLARFLRPPAFVRYNFVISVSRDWLKNTFYLFIYYINIFNVSLLTVI